MKPVWFGLIMRRKNSWILLAKVFARILYMLPKNVIGCQFPSFEWSPDFEIKVIMPLLMKSEVSPRASMALKASNSVGATSFTYSWKKFVEIPSCPGALPLGNELMASLISARDKGRVMLTFMASMTRVGTFSQHFSCALEVLEACASDTKVGIKFCDVMGEVLLVGDCPSIDL